MSEIHVIVGLGYVGLPLAREAVRSGLRVAGFDVNARVVKDLNEGVSHVDDLSDADVKAMLEEGFFASREEAVIKDAKTVVICVPTPLADYGVPDLGPVVSAAHTVGRNLGRGALVILESTSYPGTTEEMVLPILEQESGLKAGDDFTLAFSPERIDPGNPIFGVSNTPKVVGGITPESTRAAMEFYGHFVNEVVRARGTREAETAKLLENTYRHVNIALVNEMVRFCHELGIDFWDVIRLAKTKPFGFEAFYPGVGVGGHCIPIDPNYLSQVVRARLGYPFRFVELAQEINSTMPSYVATRVQEILNDDGIALKGAKVMILGVTYKPNIADQRESPVVPLALALLRRGAAVEFHDPRVEEWNLGSLKLKRVKSLEDAVTSADLTILAQKHKDYDLTRLCEMSRRFFDTTGSVTQPGAKRL